METIREADIAKLAFAAQLASEFWRRTSGEAGGGGGGEGEGGGGEGSDSGDGGGGEEGGGKGRGAARRRWAPPAMLWLVQRRRL